MQFALHEWNASLETVETIRLHSRSILKGIDLFKEMIATSKQLEKFLLFTMDNPFSQKGGTLDKLCFYCDVLCNASKVESQQSVQLLLEQMRSAVLSTRAKILSWKRKIPEVSSILAEIELLCTELNLRLREFFLALFPYFEEARSDENILFYLIEHRGQINKVMSLPIVENILSRLYPSGPTHLRAILYEGYTRRGFGDFYAEHESLIDSIQWTADEWALSTTIS